MTTIVKLGGSVVTKKDTRETVDDEALSRAANAIAEAGTDDLVLVHGGGSFGHPIAAELDVSSREGTHDAAAIRTIHRTMGTLVRRVTDDLGAARVPAVPVRPFSAGYRTAEGDVELYTDAIETLLEEGFVPVLHGDVFPTTAAGATIVSGDELVVSLARALDAERVGLCSTVPGVLDDDGEVVPRIEEYADVAAVLGGSATTDVTGGMAAKVRALLDAEVPAFIFGLDDLEEFLAGRATGTSVGPTS